MLKFANRIRVTARHRRDDTPRHSDIVIVADDTLDPVNEVVRTVIVRVPHVTHRQIVERRPKRWIAFDDIFQDFACFVSITN